MIQCPHCSHQMQLQGIRVGTFSPRCPACGKRFSLTVDPAGSPLVATEAHVGAPAPVATVPPVTLKAPPGRADRQAATRPPRPERPGEVETPAPKPTPDDIAVKEPPRVYQQSIGKLAPAEQPHLGLLTGRLGGYEIRRKLGQGGMGTVYLARQVSLDRDVAVKVLASELGRDAQFVSRFVREAYAAAQLVHHNVVQIHDIGEEDETHYYSMEFVKGRSLADLIKSEGAIAPDTAAGYILQAARGLKLAHDQGMIHRDIKPENLLLSQDGIVKVADLGLVKRQGEKESAAAAGGGAETGLGKTLAHSMMGTPAYMAPEQADDAANVDARADIYSLGCTLFALLTGRPPFEGESPEAVLQQSKLREVPSPKTLNAHVPSELSRITHLMTAHRREDRYANLAMVIRELETYLGVEVAGNFSPRQQHVDELQQCVKLFADSSMATVRRILMGGFVTGMLLITALAIWQGNWGWAGAFAATLVTTSVLYQMLACLSGRSDLACRVRQLFFHSRWRDWFRWMAIAALCVLAVLAMDLLGPAVLVGGISLLLAGGFRMTVDRMLAGQRRHSLAHAEDLLRGFRLKGLDEDAVRRFVCEYGGRPWEEFYESLFGYAAKMEARKRWGRTARGYGRPKYAAWRDPIIRWIDQREEMLRVERERKHLLRVETKALQAQGVEEVAAARQAKRTAEMMMSQAVDLREKSLRRRDEPAATVAPGAPDQVQKPREQFRFDRDAEQVHFKHSSYVSRRYGGPMDTLFGPRMRFFLAAVILLGFLVWRYENRGAIVNEIRQMEAMRIDPVAQDPTKLADVRKLADVVSDTTRPLRIWGVPDALCDAVGSWNGGAAGLILLLGSFMRGIRIGIPLMIAAAVVLLGQFLPIMSQLPGTPQHTSLLLGVIIAMVAAIAVKTAD